MNEKFVRTLRKNLRYDNDTLELIIEGIEDTLSKEGLSIREKGVDFDASVIAHGPRQDMILIPIAMKKMVDRGRYSVTLVKNGRE